MPRKSIKKKFKLYIPSSIDIDSQLQKFPPDFRFKRDKFVFFLHLLSSVNSSRKNERAVYTTLYSPLLKRKFGSNYTKYIEYLVKNRIIIVDARYSTTSHYSKRYGFADFHKTSPLKEVSISDRITIENVTRFDSLELVSDLKALPPRSTNDYAYLDKWFNEKLTINVKEATAHLEYLQALDDFAYINAYHDHMCDQKNRKLRKLYKECKNPITAYNRRLIPVLKIKNQQFQTTIDSTSYRYHSPLTNLKKDLRKFVKYNGETLVSIDIKNSQPYLSTVLFEKKFFKKNKVQSKINFYNNIDYNKSPIAHHYVSQKNPPPDVSVFVKQVTSGNFYEEFLTLLDKENLIPTEIKDKRSYVKNIVFVTFFSPLHHTEYVEEIKVFKKIYPSVFENFTFLKSNNNYHTLACVLQRIESELILEIACKKISEKYPTVPIFTIHDSIVTTIEHKQKVEDIMRDTLTEFIGYKPKLSIETWE